MSSKTICPECETANPPDSTFCAACGASLPHIVATPPSPPPTTYQPPPPSPPPTTYQPPPPSPPSIAIPPCPKCGSTAGWADVFNKALFILLLCCIGIIPGIIYYGLRHGKVRCVSCRAIK